MPIARIKTRACYATIWLWAWSLCVASFPCTSFYVNLHDGKKVTQRCSSNSYVFTMFCVKFKSRLAMKESEQNLSQQCSANYSSRLFKSKQFHSKFSSSTMCNWNVSMEFLLQAYCWMIGKNCFVSWMGILKVVRGSFMPDCLTRKAVFITSSSGGKTSNYK